MKRAKIEKRAQDRNVALVTKFAFVVAAFDSETDDVDFLPYHPFVHYSFGNRARDGDYRVFVYNPQETTFTVLDQVFAHRGDAKRRALTEHCRVWREVYDEPDFTDEDVYFQSAPDSSEAPTQRLYRWQARRLARKSFPWQVRSFLVGNRDAIRRSRAYKWCVENVGPVRVKRNWTWSDTGEGWAYVDDDFYFADQTMATAFKLLFGEAR